MPPHRCLATPELLRLICDEIYTVKLNRPLHLDCTPRRSTALTNGTQRSGGLQDLTHLARAHPSFTIIALDIAWRNQLWGIEPLLSMLNGAYEVGSQGSVRDS